MRVPAAAVWSTGSAFVLFALTFLGVPRPLLWVILIAGFGLLIYAAVSTWEASTAQRARASSFPDVAIEVTKVGRMAAPHPMSSHPMTPPGLPDVAVCIFGFKLVSHETRRNAVLTFRLFQDFDPQGDGGSDHVVCGVFDGANPQGTQPHPVLLLPVQLAPGSAVSGDIIWGITDWGDRSTGTPQRIEITDELSDAKIDIAPMLGKHRPSQGT